MVANNRTMIQESPRKTRVDKSLLKSQTCVEAATIKETLKLAPVVTTSIIAKVTEVKPPEKLLRRDKASYVTKQDCTIGDATAACRLVLWEGRIGALEQDTTYKFSELLLKVYNSKFVSVVEQTEIVQADDLGKVEVITSEEKKVCGEIGQVLQCEEYKSCTEYYAKVRRIDSICGECTGCFTMVKLQKCSQKFVAKIKVEDEDGEDHVVTMFSNTLDKVVDAAGSSTGVVSQVLMSLPKMVFTINTNNVVMEAVEKELGTWRVKDDVTINTNNVVVEAVEKDLGTWRVKDEANNQPV